MIKTKYFEEFLQEEHMKDYHGTDDDAPDAYDNWVSELQYDDWMAYGEEFGKQQYEVGQAESVDETNAKLASKIQ